MVKKLKSSVLFFNCIFSVAFVLIVSNIYGQDKTWLTPFEIDTSHSATPSECMAYYERLAATYPQIQIMPLGATDGGFTLQTVFCTSDPNMDPIYLHRQGKAIILINNAIHPGEPEGVDATMMLFRDLMQNPELKSLLDRVVFVCIPMYNLGGANNRNKYSRASQNGPDEYGFRGNAKNYDLNRDCIKTDSKEARLFNQLISWLDPDLLVDNHTSNGADYQHTMTLLATQADKLGGESGKFLREKLLPDIYSAMKKKHWDMVPYINVHGTNVSEIPSFIDDPRYTSGYAALHQIIGLVPETHMLKPFPQRVKSTYDLMVVLGEFLYKSGNKIRNVKAIDRLNIANAELFPIRWKSDRTRSEKVHFKGYESEMQKSEVSSKERMFFDRSKPFEKDIPFYSYCVATDTVQKPKAYIIPQAWEEVIRRLEWNGVAMEVMQKDTILTLSAYFVKQYQSSPSPYEGHYLHYGVVADKKEIRVACRRGDFYVPCNQAKNRYLVETLEPNAPDAFFAWNFFDAILMQKEGYSAYVFEDQAAKMLENDPELKAAFEKAKSTDSALNSSGEAQLDWVYKHSPYYEPSHNRYPVYRLEF